MNKNREDINTFEYWDAWYKQFDSSKVCLDMELDKGRFDRIIELFPQKEGLKILDIGCGRGAFVRYAKENFSYKVEYTGYDISQLAIDKAKELDKESKYEVIEWKDYNTNKKFDVICLGEVLEHIEDTDVFVSKLHQMTNIKAILTVPKEDDNDNDAHIYSFKSDDIFNVFRLWYPVSVSFLQVRNPYRINSHWLIEANK